MCFGGVVVAIDAVLQSLKVKILLIINKSWVQSFPRYESKNVVTRTLRSFDFIHGQ